MATTSAPSGLTMHWPVPSSSRNGSADVPEATVCQARGERFDRRASRSLRDAVAPPDARTLRQRREVLRARAVARPRPDQLDIPLRRRTNPRGRGVLDQARDLERAQGRRAAADDGDAQRQQPEPEISSLSSNSLPMSTSRFCSSANSSSCAGLNSNDRARRSGLGKSAAGCCSG